MLNDGNFLVKMHLRKSFTASKLQFYSIKSSKEKVVATEEGLRTKQRNFEALHENY